MSESKPTKSTELSASDKERADRLYEEVLVRLDELTMIVGRATGKRGKRFGRGTIVARTPSGPTTHMRKVEYFFDEDGNCVGMYDYDAGVCSSC